MKTKLTLIPFALLAAALVVLAVACGGAGATVTVEKGLAAAVGQERSTDTGAQPAAAAVPYAAAIASREEVAGLGYAGAAYPVSSMISGRGGESLLASLQLQAAAGITVQGYARATAPADTARVQFVVTKGYDYYPEPLPAEPGIMPEGSVESETAPSVPPDIYPTQVAPTPITEADLTPLIDAIKAQGVSDADIEVVIYPAGGYYDPYGAQTARVTVTLRDMDKVGPVVDAGTQAVNESGTLFLQNVGVLYSVDDCSVLLREARSAAVEDGRENGEGLADALGVSLGDVLAASEYVYSPFGPSPCDPSFDTYTYPYGYEGMAYDPAMPAEVQIVSNIALTFAIS
jgi:uncharacterized protein YggE